MLGLLLVHALSHKFLDLLAVVLVEGHIIVADEMVALLTRRLWCLTVAIFQPGEHRLTDVDTTVVHDIGLYHLVTVGLHNLCQRPPQKVVAYMTEVKGLIGIGR